MSFVKLLFLASLGMIVGVAAAAQESQLTLRQAVDLALEKNPAVVSSRADVDVARADAMLGRAALLPHVHFIEDISIGDDAVYAFGTKLRQGRFTESDFALNALNSPSPIGNYATRVSGTWTAFDWLKTENQIRGADLMQKSASSSSVHVDQQVVLKVVHAFQSVLYAQRQIDVTQHQLETAQALFQTVQTRVTAGLAVESDLMSAQVNVAERKQERFAADGALDTSWAELEAVIGTPLTPRPLLRPIELRHFPEGSLSDEIAMGLKARPDLRALNQERSAQRESVRAAKADFAPQINVYGNWEADRPSFAGSGGNNWVTGVQLDLDVLPLAKRAHLAEEQALRRKADAQVSAAEQQIRLSVSRAHSERHTAEQTLDTAQAATAQAAESLRIIRNRYEAGLTTVTDLLRAEDAQRQNQVDYWRAVYENAVAYAQLLYATGTLTPDSAEDLQ